MGECSDAMDYECTHRCCTLVASLDCVETNEIGIDLFVPICNGVPIAVMVIGRLHEDRVGVNEM